MAPRRILAGRGGAARGVVGPARGGSARRRRRWIASTALPGYVRCRRRRRRGAFASAAAGLYLAFYWLYMPVVSHVVPPTLTLACRDPAARANACSRPAARRCRARGRRTTSRDAARARVGGEQGARSVHGRRVARGRSARSAPARGAQRCCHQSDLLGPWRRASCRAPAGRVDGDADAARVRVESLYEESGARVASAAVELAWSPEQRLDPTRSLRLTRTSPAALRRTGGRSALLVGSACNFGWPASPPRPCTCGCGGGRCPRRRGVAEQAVARVAPRRAAAARLIGARRAAGRARGQLP